MNIFSRKYLIVALVLLAVGIVSFTNGSNLLGKFEVIWSKDTRIKQVDDELAKRLTENPSRSLKRDVLSNFANIPDVLTVSKQGPKIYTYTPQQTAAISKEKKSLLTQFSMCASGKTPASITGIKFRVYAKGQLAFIPYLDGQQLWKSEMTDFLNPNYSNFKEKTYDIILDTPVSIQPGDCRKLNLMATHIKPGAQWIIPVIIGVGTNIPVEFSYTDLTDSWIKKQLTGKNALTDYGLGVLSLFTSKPGPLVIDSGIPDLKAYELKAGDAPLFTNVWFSGTNDMSPPYQLESFDIELKTNSTQPLKTQLHFNIHEVTPFFGGSNNIKEPPSLSITLEPNKPTTIPLGVKLDSMTRFSTNIEFSLPAESAIYTFKVSNLKGNGDATMAKNNSQETTPFISKLIGTIQIDIPNKPQPAFPLNYQQEQNEDEYQGADVATQQAVMLNGLRVEHSTYSTTYAIDSLAEKLTQVPQGIGHILIKNYQAATYAMKYNSLPMSVVFKSNSQAPFKIRAHFNSSFSLQNIPPQDFDVTPGVPFTIQPPPFMNSLFITFSLLELPKSPKYTYYIQPVVNSMTFTYGKDFTVTKDGKSVVIKSGMPVPLLQYTEMAAEKGQNNPSKTSKPLTLPLVFSDILFTQPGLFEKSSDNIPPPYTKIVDIETMKPDEYFEMNQFCLTANEHVQITEMTFSHVVREKSPFKTVKIDTWAGLSIMLEKAGWTKHTAIFPMSSNLEIYAGDSTCFSLKTQGLIEDSLEGAFFDLAEIKAVTKSGKVVKTMLKNGQELSAENPLKGTHHDFF